MTDNRPQSDPSNTLRQRATLQEYEFNSQAPVVGGLIARLRRAWNGVATKWQARPVMEQQSAFNRALAERLGRPPGQAEVDDLFARSDRAQTTLTRDAARLSIVARRLGESGLARRPRIAWFSPLPPSRSGIADYSVELLPHLAKLVDLTVFTPDPATTNLPGLTVRPVSDFVVNHDEFDLPLYQMGNSDQHEWFYPTMLRYPGVVVLHDYFLHHFIRHRTVGRGRWTAYGREMAYALGGDGRELARTVREGWSEPLLFDMPLNERLIDAALGLIVHSEYVAERVRSRRPTIALRVIPHLAEERATLSLRAQLKLPNEVVLFGSFGQLTAEKRIDAALRAFRHTRGNVPNAHYLLVGGVQPDVDLDRLVTELDLTGVVHRVGHVRELPEFEGWIRTVDVVVNLRQPTVGETSGVALRAMAAARPLIVYDHGWYSEIPDAAAIKVPPDDDEALRQAMEALATSPERRLMMGQAGHDYVVEHCAPSSVAAAYVEFIRDVLGWPNG